MDDGSKKRKDDLNNNLAKEFKKIEKLANPLKASREELDNDLKKKMDLLNISLLQEIKRPYLELPVLPTDQNLSSEFYKRLTDWINGFDQSLDQEHEVGVRLVTFGQAVTFHLENMGYCNPSLISFSGFMENGEPVELIQHVSQISILLIRMKRKDPNKPKKPIGFAQSFEDEKEEET